MKKLPGIKYPLPLKIVGMGRYLPKRIVYSSQLEERCGLEPGWCERKQGVGERRWVEDETISFMAARAAEEAAVNAGIDLSHLDLIISTSQGFDQAVPAGACLIQQELGLGDFGIPCMNIKAACLGFMVALDVSASLLALGRCRYILLTSAEINSYNLDFQDPNVCTMMGDGAAAVVITRTPPGETGGIHAALMETYSEASHVSSITRGPARNTLFDKETLFESLGFEYNPQTLQTVGMKHNQKFLAKLWPLSSKDSIKLVIPNQSSRLALDMMKFIFPPAKIMGVIDRFGNTGAVGYPLALYEALQEKKIQRGDMVLMTGMGAGFSIFGIVLTY
jgi:3-oxoacyl-[acyl-carrier-protein] synthase-3